MPAVQRWAKFTILQWVMGGCPNPEKGCFPLGKVLSIVSADTPSLSAWPRAVLQNSPLQMSPEFL